jgi:hypothetical protein
LKALEKTAGIITPAMLGNAASMQTFLEDRSVLASMFNAGIHVNRPNGILIADSQVSAGRIGVDYSDRTYMVEAPNLRRTNRRATRDRKQAYWTRHFLS